ncbi:ribbon-helix-helix protein, CopG family [Natrinema longum]|uniref:CopG family transcriptional regulator n=1 Tax=Natrinema longum TaxID=370324 RepID=A0A8A2UE85_9EURY|nr:ribbon-helix-helix protein, CopG family [Natrinema longum]MBZ6496028.1 ribbon-helix-helix domain-containing protein [Natrinema longum]QSW86937.1 CopG family transcriptional regulator [Natrinema longum]
MDHNPTSRTSFGCPDDLLEQLDEIADREDKSRSQKLRELVRQEVEAKGDLEGPQPILPDDERLADAYRTLHDRAHAPHKTKSRVKLETAKNKLYTNDTPKTAVLEEIIKPLEHLGYVSVYPGNQTVWVVVRPMRYTDGEDIIDEAEPVSA